MNSPDQDKPDRDNQIVTPDPHQPDAVRPAESSGEHEKDDSHRPPRPRCWLACTDDQSVIDVNDLNHYFGEGETRKQVLFRNCLNIQRGEIIIMTGPSGSGKTTLLTLIGTLRRVQEGSLKVLGQELNGISRADTTELRKQIGFIFQAHNLFGSLTAFQNVNMAAELVGMPRRRPKTHRTTPDRLDLGERIHYKPKGLSGGQRQRVAVARGLVHSPRDRAGR